MRSSWRLMALAALSLLIACADPPSRPRPRRPHKVHKRPPAVKKSTTAHAPHEHPHPHPHSDSDHHHHPHPHPHLSGPNGHHHPY